MHHTRQHGPRDTGGRARHADAEKRPRFKATAYCQLNAARGDVPDPRREVLLSFGAYGLETHFQGRGKAAPETTVDSLRPGAPDGAGSRPVPALPERAQTSKHRPSTERA